MALILETGAGVPDADALVSVEFVDDYAARFGKSVGWVDLPLLQKEVHIRKASQFFNGKYSFAGSPKYSHQSFFFPATGFKIRGFVVEGLPVQAKNAVAELALLDAGGTDLVESVVARDYIYYRVDAAGVEEETRWDKASKAADRIFGVVEMILAPLFESGFGGGVKTVRLFPGV